LFQGYRHLLPGTTGPATHTRPGYSAGDGPGGPPSAPLPLHLPTTGARRWQRDGKVHQTSPSPWESRFSRLLGIPGWPKGWGAPRGGCPGAHPGFGRGFRRVPAPDSQRRRHAAVHEPLRGPPRLVEAEGLSAHCWAAAAPGGLWPVPIPSPAPCPPRLPGRGKAERRGSCRLQLSTATSEACPRRDAPGPRARPVRAGRKPEALQLGRLWRGFRHGARRGLWSKIWKASSSEENNRVSRRLFRAAASIHHWAGGCCRETSLVAGKVQPEACRAGKGREAPGCLGRGIHRPLARHSSWDAAGTRLLPHVPVGAAPACFPGEQRDHPDLAGRKRGSLVSWEDRRLTEGVLRAQTPVPRVLRCEQRVPAGSEVARAARVAKRPRAEPGGTKPARSPAEYNPSRRSGRLRATWTTRDRHGKQKGRDPTHRRGRSREVPRTPKSERQGLETAEKLLGRSGRGGTHGSALPRSAATQSGAGAAPRGREAEQGFRRAGRRAAGEDGSPPGPQPRAGLAGGSLLNAQRAGARRCLGSNSGWHSAGEQPGGAPCYADPGSGTVGEHFSGRTASWLRKAPAALLRAPTASRKPATGRSQAPHLRARGEGTAEHPRAGVRREANAGGGGWGIGRAAPSFASMPKSCQDSAWLIASPSRRRSREQSRQAQPRSRPRRRAPATEPVLLSWSHQPTQRQGHFRRGSTGGAGCWSPTHSRVSRAASFAAQRVPALRAVFAPWIHPPAPRRGSVPTSLAALNPQGEAGHQRRATAADPERGLGFSVIASDELTAAARRARQPALGSCNAQETSGYTVPGGSKLNRHRRFWWPPSRQRAEDVPAPRSSQRPRVLASSGGPGGCSGRGAGGPAAPT